MSRRLFRLALAAAIFACSGALANPPQETGSTASAPKSQPRVISPSGKFTAAGENRFLNSTLAAYAEDFCKRFRGVFRPQTPLNSLVRIDVTEGAPEKWNLVSLLFENKLCFHLRIRTPKSVNQQELDFHLANILFLEICNNRRRLEVGDPLYQPPNWLPAGFALWQNTNAHMRYLNLLQPLFEADRLLFPLSPEVTRLAGQNDYYRAYSFLWVKSLLQLPGGPALVCDMLERIARGTPSQQAFDESFNSSFPDRRRLEKWWSLQAVRQFELLRGDPWSLAKTDRQLGKILEAGLGPGGTPVSLESWAARRDDPRFLETVFETLEHLMALQPQAPSEYQEIIGGYRHILQRLATDPRYQPAPDIEALARHRLELLRLEESVQDYVNWFIVTQTPPDRDAFREFFETYEQIEDRPDQPPVPLRQFLGKVGSGGALFRNSPVETAR